MHGHHPDASLRWRICVHFTYVMLLLILPIVGMFVLEGHQGVFAHNVHTSGEHASGGQTSQATVSRLRRTQTFSNHTTLSHVHTSTAQTVRTQANDFCLPNDIPCLLSQAAQWVANSILSAFQPLMD